MAPDTLLTANAAAGAAAAHAAIANAIKASGVLVRMDRFEFEALLQRVEAPLVVCSQQSLFFKRTYAYLTSYKGLAFYVRTDSPLELPVGAEVVVAKSIAIPA